MHSVSVLLPQCSGLLLFEVQKPFGLRRVLVVQGHLIAHALRSFYCFAPVLQVLHQQVTHLASAEHDVHKRAVSLSQVGGDRSEVATGISFQRAIHSHFIVADVVDKEVGQLHGPDMNAIEVLVQESNEK